MVSRNKFFLIRILSSWYTHASLKEGAALSFYTVLSLPAFIVGIASLATLFFEREIVQHTIVFYSAYSFGNTGQEIIRSLVEQIPPASTLTLTSILSMLFLFATATGIFSGLQDSLNIIFHTPSSATGMKNFLQNRFFLFLLVVALGFIFIFTTFLQTFFSYGANHLNTFFHFPFDTLHLLSSLTNFILFFLLTAFLFRYLPQKKQLWSAVWLGSAVTVILFTFGKYILGQYILRANLGSAYGAAGSLLALLVWIYYSSQTLFLGAECTALYQKKLSQK